MTPTHTRTPTPVDNLIDRHLDEYAALNPIVATASGIPGHEAELPDLSPDWLASVSALRHRTIAGLADTVPIDANDRVTVAAATADQGNRCRRVPAEQRFEPGAGRPGRVRPDEDVVRR